MNKVLILAQGKEAKSFISKVIDNYLNVAVFDVIYKHESDIEGLVKAEGVRFYKINFSDFAELSYFMKKEYNKIFIIVRNRFHAIKTLQKVRKFTKNASIEFVKFWDIKLEPLTNVEIFDVTEVTTNRLSDLLPNVPLYARDIGLGEGEILEVQVPFSSNFVYRNVFQMEQKNWKIAAIYRHDSLIIPNKFTIIQPNDRLIIFGEPHILKDLFNSIKKESGLFPAPYGNNIYIIIDMLQMNQVMISKLLRTAINLYKKTKIKKVIIKVINPTVEHKLEKLQRFENIDILIDYFKSDVEKIIKEDIYNYSIGVLVVTTKFFQKHIRFLYELKRPILKLGKESLRKCSKAGVLLSAHSNLEKISPVIFDLSAQLKLKIKFLNNDPEANDKEDVIEHFEHLLKIYYYKNAEFVTSQNNPVKEIKKMENICFFMPFNKKIITGKTKAMFQPNVDTIYHFLDEYNQLFIPSES